MAGTRRARGFIWDQPNSRLGIYVNGTKVGHFTDATQLAGLAINNLPIAGPRPWIDPTHPTYGARGNGATDDTAAIQGAINAAAVAGGGKVFLPAGTYLISTPLTIYSYVTMMGVGWASILKLSNGANCNLFNITDHDYAITLRDLQLLGNYAANPSVGTGIYGTYVSQLYIQNVYMYEFLKGIDIIGMGNLLYESIVSDCLEYGVRWTTDSSIIDCYIGDNGYPGSPHQWDWDACNLFIDGWVTRIIGNHFWNSRRNIYGNWCEDLFVANNVCEESQEHNIFLTGRANQWRIIGNLIRDTGLNATNTYHGIHCDATSGGETMARNVISGNVFIKRPATIPQAAYCIYEDTGSDRNVISGNTFHNAFATNTVHRVGANTVVRGNGTDTGKDLQNGTATITAGNTFVTVSHSMYEAPSRVFLTPTTDTAGKRYWVSAKTTTTFTITIDGAAGGDISFDWRAATGAD